MKMKLRNPVFRPSHRFGAGRGWIKQHDITAKFLDERMLEANVPADTAAVDDAATIEPFRAKAPTASRAAITKFQKGETSVKEQTVEDAITKITEKAKSARHRS